MATTLDILVAKLKVLVALANIGRNFEPCMYTLYVVV